MIQQPIPIYSDYKATVQAGSFPVYHHVNGGAIQSIAVNGPIYYTHKVSKENEADYLATIGANQGKSIGKYSPVTGRDEVQVMKPEGSSFIEVTHDLCDKCTWYQNATQVTGETMTDSGDGLTFNSLNERWIDLTHGRLYGEDGLADKKEPVIYDNGTEVTSGITIDYDSGDVTFTSAPTGPITCDYWYGSDSTFTLAPTPGKTLFIEHAELQFSKNIAMSAAVTFEVWVYNPLDLPNKVPYQVIKYKNMKDIINSANLGQGSIPAMPASGITEDTVVLPFNYATVKPFQSSVGAELRIKVENNTEFGGDWGTGTFYCLSEDE